jgi:hypothetical protein
MTWTTPDGGGKPESWSARARKLFSAPPRAATAGAANATAVDDILPPEERKAAMSTLDDTERKWALIALLLATVASIAAPAYFLAANKVTKAGKNSIPIAPDALLLGGVILIFCLIGFLALWKRRRTLVAFDLFLVGFGLTILIQLVGLAYIFLGGWLMLRAWRLNKYGTTNSKAIAREAAARRKGGGRTAAATKSQAKGKTVPKTAERKPPTASKRYTPKAPPRKKIPKPAE